MNYLSEECPQVCWNFRKTFTMMVGVFFYGFVIHYWIFSHGGVLDQKMWADQIEYFINRDPRMFDFSRAYGHPGGTLIGLGSLFHLMFGVSYLSALRLSASLLIAGNSALCVGFCVRLTRQPYWWLAAVFTLLLNRMYIDSTPTTAVTMPLITLMVLMTWWLWKRRDRVIKWMYFGWGAVFGVSAATRLDVSLVVGGALFGVNAYRHRWRFVPSAMAGGLIGLFVMDPFFWFMPLRHMADLLQKFTMHYDNDKFIHAKSIELIEWPHIVLLSLVTIVFALILWKQKRLRDVIPIPVFFTYIVIFLVATLTIVSSSYQEARYFYPLTMFMEVILSLFLFEMFNPLYKVSDKNSGLLDQRIQYMILSIVIFLQLSAYMLRWKL